MSKSNRLRIEDVRSAFRLLGEVRELGSQPLVWRRHMAAELARITGAAIALSTELRLPAPTAPSMVEVGWRTESERLAFWRHMSVASLAADPQFRETLRRCGKFWTLTRVQMIEDREWYADGHFESRRGSGVDDFLFSSLPLPGPHWQNTFQLCRGVRDQPFGPRERRLVHLFHEELGRVWHTPPLAGESGALPPLPPHLEKLLSAVRGGGSEKEMAASLGLSPHTVHNYLKALYRRANVSSRAELMAKWPAPASFRPLLEMPIPLAPEVGPQLGPAQHGRADLPRRGET